MALLGLLSCPGDAPPCSLESAFEGVLEAEDVPVFVPVVPTIFAEGLADTLLLSSMFIAERASLALFVGVAAAPGTSVWMASPLAALPPPPPPPPPPPLLSGESRLGLGCCWVLRPRLACT